MTRRRWIADEFSDHHACLLGQNAAHLARVLRARVGQEYDIVCGELVRRGTVASVSDERVEFALGETCSKRGEREIVLVVAIYKFDRLEWAIEKCTELGVTRIIPVIARRTDHTWRRRRPSAWSDGGASRMRRHSSRAGCVRRRSTKR